MSRIVRIASLALALAASACGGTTYNAQGRAPFVGVDVEMKVSADTGSQRVSIEVEHLFAPSRVSPELTQYVVWFAPQDGVPVRAATLVYDEDSQSGLANASYPDARFKIILTAEAQGIPASPSANLIAEQLVNLN